MTACIFTHCLLQNINIRFIHLIQGDGAPSHAQVQPDVNDHTAVAVQDSAGLTEHAS